MQKLIKVMVSMTLAIAVAVPFVTGSDPAAGQNQGVADKTPYTCDKRTVKGHIGKHNRMARIAWAEKRWREGKPIKRWHRRTMRWHRKCTYHNPADRKMLRGFEVQKKQFYRHRKLKKQERALTPYNCGSAGRYAIPCYIVACESGYSWSAYNPSGAAGPYQIMPEWGRPWPANTQSTRTEHHRIAAMIWSGGSGASNWVCA